MAKLEARDYLKQGFEAYLSLYKKVWCCIRVEGVTYTFAHCGIHSHVFLSLSLSLLECRMTRGSWFRCSDWKTTIRHLSKH
jgi:hypothetical protein